MNKKYFNKCGVAVTESVGIAILVTCAIIAGIFFLKRNSPSFSIFGIENRELKESIKKDRAEAVLVLTGRIAAINKDYREGWSNGDPLILGFAHWDFIIESVERGYHPHKKINFYIGWGSNLSVPHEYPLGTKQDYKVGDRVRVFLSYGDPFYGDTGRKGKFYFTKLALFSLDDLGGQAKRR